jgi:hypothetical protein
MSRVRLLEHEETEGEVARTFEMIGKIEGKFSNSQRATAHSPFLNRIMYPFIRILMREGLGTVLSTKIKEMVVIKTSHLNDCEF